MAAASSALARTALLGIVAGMRAEVPLMLLTRKAKGFSAKQRALRAALPHLLRTQRASKITRSLAGLEMVADKSPAIPSRLAPLSLVGRAVFGAYSAAILGRRLGIDRSLAAVVGALGALAGAKVFHDLRVTLPRRFGLPDLPFALGEDALSIAFGRWALGT